MKTYKVIWSNSAKFDLKQIIEYIKIDSIEIAKDIFLKIKEESNKLYFYPERKRVVPELQQIGIFKYRELIYKRWRIIFKIEKEVIHILLVIDSSRNIEDILFSRLLK